ncbi:MAG: serine hydrolase [Actinomycetota bacterium]
MFTPYAGPGSFGHPGAGGSVAFAHPERNLAFAYVMNQMATNLANDRRAQSLTDAAAACADAA